MASTEGIDEDGGMINGCAQDTPWCQDEVSHGNGYPTQFVTSMRIGRATAREEMPIGVFFRNVCIFRCAVGYMA
jgi:hypothetical protein